MTTDPHIGLFYSYGPHFIKTARALRAEYPKARITAFLPREFPVGLLSGLDIESLQVLPTPGAHRSLAGLYTLVRTIRAYRLDLFVILFNSPRLRLLSSLSGAAERQCRLVDGRRVPVRFTLAGGALHTLRTRIGGHLRYARIWIEVRLTRVGVPASGADGQEGGPSDGPSAPQA